jgi:hypothetical protein
MNRQPSIAREPCGMNASWNKRVILYLTCGLRNGLGAEFLNRGSVGALRRRNSSDRCGFRAALAPLQKRANGYGEGEREKRAIAEQG